MENLDSIDDEEGDPAPRPADYRQMAGIMLYWEELGEMKGLRPYYSRRMTNTSGIKAGEGHLARDQNV